MSLVYKGGKDFVEFLHSSFVFLTIDSDFWYLLVQYKWKKSCSSSLDERLHYQPS